MHVHLLIPVFLSFAGIPGIAASGTPAHAAAGETVVDHRFAGALHRAGTDRPALAQVIGIVHLVLVIAKVVCLATVSFTHPFAAVAHIERF